MNYEPTKTPFSRSGNWLALIPNQEGSARKGSLRFPRFRMLYWGLRFLAERYKLPIVITENGMTGRDSLDVRGYFHWSLMNNLEWAEGYKQRFSLFHVDYATQKRMPKDSFGWYGQLITTNGEELT